MAAFPLATFLHRLPPGLGSRLALLGAVVVTASACGPARSVSATPSPQTNPLIASPSRISTPTPTLAATPTSDPDEPMPPGFSTSDLRPGVLPQAYLSDPCEYLRMRWDPAGSAPGTVVVPIMYHSIREPGNMPADEVTVSTEYLEATVARAQALGFETITAQELVAFLTRNAPIPARSMILIVDDRYPGAVGTYLLPFAEREDWTITLAWPIGDTGPSLWATVEGLAAGGRLDIQSHGLRHQYITDEWTDDAMREEIGGPIRILQEHFGERPVAFVWPGGNFTRRSVEIAREEGFQVGFTARSRGPLLFNWIPLGEEEQAVDDPRMVLPRAWSPSAIVNLELAARIGDEAARQAQEAHPAEADWYRRHCGGDL